MDKVVYIILKGRLGNNMYQYAYALSLHNRGYNVVCVSGIYDAEHYLNPYVLDKNVKIVHVKSLTSKQLACPTLANEDPVWIPTLPPPEHLATSVLINSYFQSEFFFGNVVNDVKNAFTLKEDIEAQGNKFGIILGRNSCSITVRLTDYLTNSLYTPLDISYYEKAVKTMLESTYDSDLIFFNVFSDDIKLAEQKLSPLKKILGDQLNFIDCPNPYKTIELLKLHQNSIIANSTFAWWGAYLNEKNGVVVYPRDWFTRQYTSHAYQVANWKPV